VVVHGGGKQISSMLSRLGVEAHFDRGQRITDESTLQVVEMVLSGSINAELVRQINILGGSAVGLSGCDGGLARAQITRPELGRVGEVREVSRQVIDKLIADFIPVVAPLATGPDGGALNINADVFASRLAAAIGAEKLVLLTDVAGVLDKDHQLISTLGAKQARRLIAEGVIAGGMSLGLDFLVTMRGSAPTSLFARAPGPCAAPGRVRRGVAVDPRWARDRQGRRL